MKQANPSSYSRKGQQESQNADADLDVERRRHNSRLQEPHGHRRTSALAPELLGMMLDLIALRREKDLKGRQEAYHKTTLP